VHSPALAGLFGKSLVNRSEFDGERPGNPDRFNIGGLAPINCEAMRACTYRPLKTQIPVCSTRIGFGSGTWGISAFAGIWPKATGFKFLQRLHNFVSRVHDERPVVLNWLTNRLASQNQHLEMNGARVLVITGARAKPIAGPTMTTNLTRVNYRTNSGPAYAFTLEMSTSRTGIALPIRV